MGREGISGWLQKGKLVRDVMLVREFAEVMSVVRPTADGEGLSHTARAELDQEREVMGVGVRYDEATGRTGRARD